MSESQEQPPTSVLVVDDDSDHADAVEESLSRVGYLCSVAHGGQEAIEKIQSHSHDIVITDLLMRDVDGLAVLRTARQTDPGVSVFVLTAYGSIDTAVRAIREGAADYLEKPIQLEALRTKVAREVERRQLRQDNVDLRRQLDEKLRFENLIGHSQGMREIFERLRNVAPTNATVLILGETGTGKELIAQAIHNSSPRRVRPFVAVNCATLDGGLIESELFGHEKGSFTGAARTTQGRFQYATGGTIFLDEVGDMPASTQAKLLRALETRKIVKVGGNKEIPVDVRVLAATNQDLEQKAGKAEFRTDLLYRLQVVQIELPALRERPVDIPLLIDAFIRELAATHQRPVRGANPRTIRRLKAYSWPGNVRQLRNVLESMIVSCGDRTTLEERDLPPSIPDFEEQIETPRGELSYTLAGKSLVEVERELIMANLELTDGNRERCAKILGIGERTLYRKLKEYGLRGEP